MTKSLQEIFTNQEIESSQVAQGIRAISELYDTKVKPVIGGNLSIWDRFLLLGASEGLLPVVEACLDNGANVNCVSDGKNHAAFALLKQELSINPV